LLQKNSPFSHKNTFSLFDYTYFKARFKNDSVLTLKKFFQSQVYFIHSGHIWPHLFLTLLVLNFKIFLLSSLVNVNKVNWKKTDTQIRPDLHTIVLVFAGKAPV